MDNNIGRLYNQLMMTILCILFLSGSRQAGDNWSVFTGHIDTFEYFASSFLLMDDKLYTEEV